MVDGPRGTGAETAPGTSGVAAIVEGLLAEIGGPSVAVRADADLERDLGLGSLERAELLARIEAAFGVKMPDDTLRTARSVAALERALERARGGETARATDRWRGGQDAPATEARARPDEEHARVPPQHEVASLAALIRHRARVSAGRVHLRLLDDEGRAQPVTFDALGRDAAALAEGLRSRGLLPGDRVILLLPTSADFFRAFAGVVSAGAVAVPIYPPIRMDALAGYLERADRLIRNAGARAIVADRPLLQLARLLADRNGCVEWVCDVETLRATAPEARLEVEPEQLALIQYSSGSTGDPKGVALRHRNLLANMHAIGRGVRLSAEDVAVSWLPLYHDMGLIGVWLTALLHGIEVVVLSPLQFLARPERWLWALHRFGGTLSPAPNFAYELCVRKIRDADIEGLNLARWRVAMNGSEPVRPETLERFCRRFAPYGFRREALMPVYGLAETSVALCFPPLGRGPRIDRVDRERFTTRGEAQPSDGDEARTIAFVGVGRPLEGHEIRIADREDPHRGAVPERVEGRILFRGPSTMRGYFGRPDATEAVSVGEGWIDTGDLGYLADGELFVTGRAKEIVIKGGRKYHPHDIERAVWEVPGVRKGCVVAFDAPDPVSGEAIVVVAETREPPARHGEIEAGIRSAVSRAIGAPADRVLLVAPGTIPKTSSGKLRRRETRSRYLAGALRPPARGGGALRLAGLAAGAAGRRARAALRQLSERAWGLWAFGAIGSAAVLSSAAAGYGTRRTETAWSIMHHGLRLGFRLAGLGVRRSGPPLPPGPCVIVSNHASYLDAPVVVAGLEAPARYTAKAPAFEWPLVGAALRATGTLAIDRRDAGGRLRSLAAAEQALRAGARLHVFPEGTFTAASGLRPFRLGAFELAVRLGLPVVPAAVIGTRTVYRYGFWLPRPGRLEVRVLEPVAPPAPDAGFAGVVALRDRVRRELAQAVGEPLLEITSAGLPPGVSDGEPEETASDES
ncbi:MAG: acyl-phosphate glycerol 3-phosphate acyltransferase [Planctomycetota bacterium]|nr:MAG: acyl-phosphate glycerol 3-phosphate acyltransferase [Planctomycetota bacterium]